MASGTPITVYFDFISPYAYIAWRVLRERAGLWGLALQPVPVLFAAMLNAFGHKGPAEIPPKRLYVIKDVMRKAAAWGLGPVRVPPTHPFNPLFALRVATAAPAELQVAVIDALFNAAWQQGRSIEEATDVHAILAAHRVGAADALLERGTREETKLALRGATDAAIARGAFGVPTMICRQELFWGVDSLAHLRDFAAGKDSIDYEVVATWAAIEPSARR
jgi:2-hydroxychromene-2-carboxylate isomerase